MKPKQMYPHRCRICNKTYYNARCGKKQGMCCTQCKSVDTKITGRLKLYPLKDAAALKKHLKLMFKTIDEQMEDKQRMIDLMSSYEWEMLIELCETDWPFLKDCSEEELDALPSVSTWQRTCCIFRQRCHRRKCRVMFIENFSMCCIERRNQWLHCMKSMRSWPISSSPRKALP